MIVNENLRLDEFLKESRSSVDVSNQVSPNVLEGQISDYLSKQLTQDLSSSNPRLIISAISRLTNLAQQHENHFEPFFLQFKDRLFQLLTSIYEQENDLLDSPEIASDKSIENEDQNYEIPISIAHLIGSIAQNFPNSLPLLIINNFDIAIANLYECKDIYIDIWKFFESWATLLQICSPDIPECPDLYQHILSDQYYDKLIETWKDSASILVQDIDTNLTNIFLIFLKFHVCDLSNCLDLIHKLFVRFCNSWKTHQEIAQVFSQFTEQEYLDCFKEIGLPQYLLEHFPTFNHNVQMWALQILAHMLSPENFSYFLSLTPYSLPFYICSFIKMVSISNLMPFFQYFIESSTESRNMFIKFGFFTNIKHIFYHSDGFGHSFSDQSNAIISISNFMKYLEEPSVLNEFLGFPYSVLPDFFNTKVQSSVIFILYQGLLHPSLSPIIVPLFDEDFIDEIEEQMSESNNSSQITALYQQLTKIHN